MEFVEEAVHHGGEDHAAHHQKHHAAEERIERRKPFSRVVVQHEIFDRDEQVRGDLPHFRAQIGSAHV
jgi:hypothetical protein